MHLIRVIVAGLGGFMVGLAVAGAILGGAEEVETPTIICPPFMDKAQQEIIGIDIWYELGMGPEFTELDLEFAQACGFESITGPTEILPPEPPPPEEGGA